MDFSFKPSGYKQLGEYIAYSAEAAEQGGGESDKYPWTAEMLKKHGEYCVRIAECLSTVKQSTVYQPHGKIPLCVFLPRLILWFRVHSDYNIVLIVLS